MADFGVFQTFGMSFEYNVASYTLHLIDLYSVRYGKIVLTLKWSRKEKKMGNQIHVTKVGENWVVKQEGAERASAIRETQSEAKARAIEIAKHQGLEVVVHGVDGKIREKNSYGNDPFPPRG